MSDDASQGVCWDNVTAYRPPADRIESVARWQTPELDLHGYYLREIPEQVWTMVHLKELHLYYKPAHGDSRQHRQPARSDNSLPA